MRLRDWNDLGQLIRDRLNECMNQALNYSFSGWNTASSSARGPKPASEPIPKKAKASKKSNDDDN